MFTLVGQIRFSARVVPGVIEVREAIIMNIHVRNKLYVIRLFLLAPCIMVYVFALKSNAHVSAIQNNNNGFSGSRIISQNNDNFVSNHKTMNTLKKKT